MTVAGVIKRGSIVCGKQLRNVLWLLAVRKQSNLLDIIGGFERVERRLSHVACCAGNSDYHRFLLTGDPLLVSPLDIYSATKLRGEFKVLESALDKWAVLRQTAMLHPQMLNDNIHDGPLMLCV